VQTPSLIGSALSYGTVPLADNTIIFTVNDARPLVPPLHSAGPAAAGHAPAVPYRRVIGDAS
jgi:hypothetical protein